MRGVPRFFPAIRFAVVIAAAHGNLTAQPVTTGTIAGTVRDERRALLDGAVVRVVNATTGYSFPSSTRDGRFAVQGLPVGGPYSVVIEFFGYAPSRRDGILLRLGEEQNLEFALVEVALTLDTLRLAIEGGPRLSSAHSGIGIAISDSILHRLPTIDRDLYDFVRLAPQISARSARTGLSAGGVSVRFNNFQVDGVSDRALLGNFAGGTAQGGKAISIEAIEEYQVLVSPYDVRYGDFAGALVNAVTRSGTNQLRGTVFGYTRSEALARGTDFLRERPYERTQFGFVLGGPIARDRAHFFMAVELQRLTAPATGPYLGQGETSALGVPASQADLSRFADALRGYGIEPGSAGPVEVGTPLVNLFGRIDMAWPHRSSRLVLWSNYSRASNRIFSRGTSTSFLTRGGASFQLSGTAYTATAEKSVTSAQLYTYLGGGGLNELLIAFKSLPSLMTPDVYAPAVAVAVPRTGAPGSTVWLQAGSDEAAHGISVDQTSIEISDHFTFSPGTRHRAAVGARLELLELRGGGLPGTFGYWDFPSLEALSQGGPARYRLIREPEDRSPRRAAQYSVYVADEWRPADRLTVLVGLRGDLLARANRPRYDAVVDSVLGRRTSAIAGELMNVSPRIGFTWDVSRDGRAHVRGGIGLFSVRPPMGYLGSAFRSYGSGTRELLCGVGTAGGAAPPFVPNHRLQPSTCADGSGPSSGPVHLEDPDLKMAETLRASLTYERSLPGLGTITVEGLYTKNRSDFAFVNLNLAGPRGVDRRGRVLYGTFESSGVAVPVRATNRFPEVVELRNQSRNHSTQLALRLEREFSDQLEVAASYAFSRVRDVQTPPDGFQPFENWRRGRVVSGNHDAMDADVSALDIPHRVVVFGTARAPWRRWVTDFSFYYVGESGAPFTYIASTGGRGDLNADGTNLNDPVYIPRAASDPSEIQFAGTPAEIERQQAGLDWIIETTDCLRRQQGRIMARNSCRAPWVHVTNASVRQSVPIAFGHTLTAQLDVFNVLNLLDRDWGLVRVLATGPNPPLLDHVGQTPGPSSEPVFRFDPARVVFDSQNVESAFQLQLALRYTF